jgi:hypothetical protein
MFRDWNVAEAERLFRAGLKRAALHVDGYRLYVDAAAIRGHIADAKSVLAVPLSVLPRSPVLRYAAYSLSSIEHNYEECERIAAESLKWEPQNLGSSYLVARARAESNKPDAEQLMLDVLKRDPKHAGAIYNVARLRVLSDRDHEAQEMLNLLSSDRYPSLKGLVAAAKGDAAGAVAWFERADKLRDENLLYVILDVHVQALRSEPEIEALFRRFRG